MQGYKVKEKTAIVPQFQNYNSFFVINCHIARQDFILNDQFSGGRNPSKILKYQSIVFYVRCIDVTPTQTESDTEVFQSKQNPNINLDYTIVALH
jgi:hypothetical protein